MNQSFQNVSIKANNKTTRAARPMREIPTELDLNNIYFPKYHITELMSTKSRNLDDAHIRRPPNGFFLMKNCYMLELRKLGYRYTMPEICRHSKKIWSELPQHAKKTYERLSLESQCVHNERYPNYKFEPKKRNNRFKSYTPKIEDLIQKNTTAFSTTNILGSSNHPSDKDLCSSNSLPSSESEIFGTSNFPSDKDSCSSDSLQLSESEIFGTSNFLSDKDSHLSNSLLSSEICSSPTNSLDIDAILMNSSLGDFPSLESFSSSEVFSSTSFSSSEIISPELSTSFSSSEILPPEFSTSFSSLSPEFLTLFESQFEMNGLGLSELGLNELRMSNLELNELGIVYPFMGILEDIQPLPNYLNTPNDISADNYDCYVNNCFPFIIEDNSLQQNFVGSDSVSSFVSTI